MGATLDYPQHLAIELANQKIPPPHPKGPWRVLLLPFSAREGVFVRGGRFCTPPPAAPDTTPTVPPSRDISTLPRHFHPPETNTPSRDIHALQSGQKKTDHRPPKQRWRVICPWRAILHALTSHYRHNADISTLPQQIHPPAKFSPSGADSGTEGFKDPVQQKARGRGGGAGRE